MIKFKNLEYRDKAIIYHTTLDQIKKVYEKNPQQAGELAIAAIEVALAGEHSSDDYMIDVILEQAKYLSTKNKESYEKTVDAKKEKRITELQLREIVELMNQGFNQTQIGAKLGTTKQNISKRVGIMRTSFPELLTTSQQNLVDNNLTTQSKPSKLKMVDDNRNQLKSTGQPKIVDIVDDNLTEFTSVDLVDDLSTEIDCQPKNSGQFDNQVNQVNYNDNDNDNVNDNVNISRVFPSENTLETISLEELNRMRAEYTLDDEGVATFSTGYRVKVKFDF